jgi:type I restriction enzyme S subunit
MTDRNANRPGYKQTKVGWIPEEWMVKTLSKLCSVKGEYGASEPSVEFSEELPQYIRITDITDNGTLDPEVKCSVELPDEEIEKYKIKKGDIFFARSGATVGKTYTHLNNKNNLVFAGYLIRFHPKAESLNPIFLHNFTHSSNYWRWVNSVIHVGAQPNINAKEYGSLFVPVPPLNEQNKIAEILSTWDRAIEQTQKLIDAKQRLKKGLMQQLLTGRMRFPGFGPPVEKAGELPEGWEEKTLGHFLRLKLRKEKKPNLPFRKLGIRSHGKGIFINENEDPNSYSMDYFYRVSEDDVVVNITFAWEGAIAFVGPTGDNALVSHRFPTYVVNKKIMDVHYLKYLIHTNRFFYDLGTISPGGAGRNRVLSKRDFLKIKVQYPKLEEQNYASNSLKTLDGQIENFEILLTNYTQQKDGLMQMLLTGEVRVKM